MDTHTSHASSSASVFETRSRDPRLGADSAVADIARHLAKYAANRDVADRMTLLTEVEALRRYVLVPGALLASLRAPTGEGGGSIGKVLCAALRGMIGELPETGKTNSLQGARNVERDTRRAAASLAFLEGLDPSFA